MKTFPSLRLWQISAALFALSFAQFATAQPPTNPGAADAKLDPPVKPAVAGKFVGNGKDAAIKFVLVEEREAFSDKEAIKLIFTEKDPATAKKPSWDAGFGKLGSALVLSVFYDGQIFGCEVSHSAHSKRGFSSVGEIKMVEFKIAGGNVTGHVSTGKELDAFGEKWEVDLTFAAPLPAKLRNAAATPPNAPGTPPKPVTNEPGEPAKKKKEAKVKAKADAEAGPLISARKLALPKDATDVEFKQLVKHIQFSSALPVEAVAKEFSANLKQQGWKDGAGSLMGKKNAILKREQGGAKLTIMIQPAAAGSVVKIFTEGLDWSGGDDATPATAKKPADGTSADDFEAQARKAIQDALKGVPKLP
jgi:hypothetical protein